MKQKLLVFDNVVFFGERVDVMAIACTEISIIYKRKNEMVVVMKNGCRIYKAGMSKERCISVFNEFNGYLMGNNQ